MPITTMRAALNEALRLAMQNDPDVFIIGEDIAGGADALSLFAGTLAGESLGPQP